jgi:hypothetical protein
LTSSSIDQNLFSNSDIRIGQHNKIIGLKITKLILQKFSFYDEVMKTIPNCKKIKASRRKGRKECTVEYMTTKVQVQYACSFPLALFFWARLDCTLKNIEMVQITCTSRGSLAVKLLRVENTSVLLETKLNQRKNQRISNSMEIVHSMDENAV